MRKLKLKEDEDGNKTTDVRGIRAACKVMKTRYNKPFETCQVKIPWDSGMNPFSGIWEMIEDSGMLIREGNRYKVTFSDGEEFIGFRKAYTDEVLMKIMKDYDFLSGKVFNDIKEASVVEEE